MQRRHCTMPHATANVDALTALLEADAAIDIDIRSGRGSTPIDCAEGYGHAVSARMLRSAREVESACTASSESTRKRTSFTEPLRTSKNFEFLKCLSSYPNLRPAPKKFF